jgi:ArsR family transcriptional regulator, lead/cadmium/zinc/bismuth-responsive transcriptional repressor
VSKRRPDNGNADLCEIACVDQEKVDRARRRAPSVETLTTTAEILRALGDPTRLQLVALLALEDEFCVCDLAALSGVSQSGVSHSLRTLRQLGLVRYRKVGRIAYYRLQDDHIAHFVAEAVQHVLDAEPGGSR